MFRMNGISRVSTWMCDAIVSVLHSLSIYVRRDYVQDERYIAGAGMRRSGACQSCTAPRDLKLATTIPMLI